MPAPPIVSDTVGLLWQGGEDGCCFVCHTRLACLTDLHDSPFYCTSTNHIQLTAGRYSSFALSSCLYNYSHAVAHSDSLVGLKLCGPGSKPKPLNLHQRNTV